MIQTSSAISRKAINGKMPVAVRDELATEIISLIISKLRNQEVSFNQLIEVLDYTKQLVGNIEW